MRYRLNQFRAPLFALLFCTVAAAYVLAQYPAGQPAVGQVNPQVNTALYGGGVPSSVRYATPNTSNPLPSEFKYAAWKSGALPSDIRMGYAAMGPMSAGGPMDYIPASTPSYVPKPNTAPPSAMGSAAYSNASIRYSSPAPASAAYVPPVSHSNQVSPALVSRGPVNSGPINSGPINNSTVRYAR